MQWIDEAPRMLGAPVAITPDNAIEVARQEMGGCYSRFADDCLSYTPENLAKHGLTERCARLTEAMRVSNDDKWATFIDEVPYCPGYFDYQTSAAGARKPSPVVPAAVGFAIGAVVGIVLG